MMLCSGWYIYVYLCLLYFDTAANSEITLRQIHVLFRHGERSPTAPYPNDPHKNYNWPGGWGHLTNRGKKQMFFFGENLRTQYKHFLPELYWPTEVNVSSSYADRCLMSAELVAAGLFPPKGVQIWNEDLLWQPVPIYYLPRSQDTFIAMKAACPKYDKTFDEVMNSTKVRNIFKENQNLLKHIAENAGFNINNLGQVETLFNSLEIEQLNNLTLPGWVNTTLMQTMKEMGSLNLALYSETDFMKRMKGGVFLKNVITYMENILQGKNVPLLYLYSGHDISIVHVLRSLNLVNTIKPSFGASLVFELYSDNSVKIIYRDSWDANAEEKFVDSCGPTCKLDQLKTVLEPMLPINWEEECKL